MLSVGLLGPFSAWFLPVQLRIIPIVSSRSTAATRLKAEPPLLYIDNWHGLWSVSYDFGG